MLPGRSRMVATARRVLRHARAAAVLVPLAACSQAVRLPPVPPATDIPELERRAALNPGDVQSAVRLGAAYWAAGRLPEALSRLTRAEALDPGNLATAFFLGVTHEDLGDYAGARRMYGAYLERGASPRLRAAVRDRLTLMARRELEAAVRDALAREAELGAEPPGANTVGLFPFLYAGVDANLAPLSRALADMLATDLSRTGRLSVVERLHV